MRPLSKRLKGAVFYAILAVGAVANWTANGRMWLHLIGYVAVMILVIWIWTEGLKAELERIARQSLERLAEEVEDAPAL